MTVAISLSATVMVACLFAPKLYIILVHPERNVRQSMMPTGRSIQQHSNPVGVQIPQSHPYPIQMQTFQNANNLEKKIIPKPTKDASTQSECKTLFPNSVL